MFKDYSSLKVDSNSTDSTDGHLTDSEIINTLTDLFPAVPRSELIARVESTRDIGTLIDNLFLEQESSSRDGELKKYSTEVYTLKEIFPNSDLEYLQSLLNHNDGDIEKSIAHILQGNTENKHKNKYKLKHDSKSNINNERKKPQSSWDAIQTDASNIASLLEIPFQRATSYLHKHEGKFFEALIDIIYNYSLLHLANSSDILSNPQSSIVSPIPRGGRVQGPFSISLSPLPLKTPPTLENDTYIYDDNSKESKEMKAIYRGNIEFKSINEQFFEKALAFFKGDVMKVIAIASMLIEENAQRLTFIKDLTNGGVSLKKSTSTVRDKFLQPHKLYNSSSQGLNLYHLNDTRQKPTNSIYNPPLPIHTPEEVQLKNERLRSAAKTNTLDLHNLRVATALQAATQALYEWWNDELDQRLADGNLGKFGYKAQFVGPLQLVTGRGIHSIDGKGKIRTTVRKHLDVNNYVYDEHPGRFEVQGRRKY